jgi:quinol monooxygenase YgiN
MVWLHVRHRVEDFARWKGLFEDIRPVLEDTGALKAMVLRDKDDEDVISVVCSWEDAASAQRFLESEGLREALERAWSCWVRWTSRKPARGRRRGRPGAARRRRGWPSTAGVLYMMTEGFG